MPTFMHISVIESCDKTLISDAQGRKFSHSKITKIKSEERKNSISWGKEDRTRLFVNSNRQLKWLNLLPFAQAHVLAKKKEYNKFSPRLLHALFCIPCFIIHRTLLFVLFSLCRLSVLFSVVICALHFVGGQGQLICTWAFILPSGYATCHIPVCFTSLLLSDLCCSGLMLFIHPEQFYIHRSWY